MDTGNLISSSFAFSKSSWYIWKFSARMLLKPISKDSEYYLASMWNESNCAVAWTFFGIALLWHWNENWPFPVLWPLLSFPICWHIECNPLTASSFRILNGSGGIPSPLIALFIVMLLKAHLTSHSRISGSRWMAMPLWLSGSLRPFLHSSSVYHLFLLSFAFVRSLLFLSIVPILHEMLPGYF